MVKRHALTLNRQAFPQASVQNNEMFLSSPFANEGISTNGWRTFVRKRLLRFLKQSLWSGIGYPAHSALTLAVKER